MMGIAFGSAEANAIREKDKAIENKLEGAQDQYDELMDKADRLGDEISLLEGEIDDCKRKQQRAISDAEGLVKFGKENGIEIDER
jgi:predicted  nucleic acid-binding Zn-ribbon protein